MDAQETRYQALKADVARWFTKDGEAMPMFHGRNDKGYPVTREEQDRWLAIGYELARRAAYPYSSCDLSGEVQKRWPTIESDIYKLTVPSAYSGRAKAENLGLAITAVAGFFILPFFLPSSLKILGAVIPVGCALTLIIRHVVREQFALNAIPKLRQEIEQKVQWRDPVNVAPKRANAFRFTAIFGALLIAGTAMLTAIIRPNDDRLIAKVMLGEIIVIVLIYILSEVAVRLDKANIRQTGKWFRWPRRGS